MSVKLHKLLNILSSNCRATTKEIGQKLGVSQQSASYMLSNILKKKQVQNYQTIIDPAKFGLINILVLYRYKKYDAQTGKSIKAMLKKHPFTTLVEDVSQGADLLVQYTVPNLSLFNKQHRDLLHDQNLNIAEIYMIVVKHLYEPKYLIKKPEFKEVILSGDRDPITLNKNQNLVLEAFRKNAKEPVINIAKKLKVDAKTVVSIKKYLEKHKVIRKYSVLLNYENLEINRSYIFIQLDYEHPNEVNKFVEFARHHKNVVEVTKILGKYELLVGVEYFLGLKKIINEFRSEFNVSDYLIVNSNGIIKNNYVPDSIF